MWNGQNIRKICMENVYISAMKEWRSLHLPQHFSPLKMRSKLRLAEGIAALFKAKLRMQIPLCSLWIYS